MKSLNSFKGSVSLMMTNIRHLFNLTPCVSYSKIINTYNRTYLFTLAGFKINIYVSFDVSVKICVNKVHLEPIQTVENELYSTGLNVMLFPGFRDFKLVFTIIRLSPFFMRIHPDINEWNACAKFLRYKCTFGNYRNV